MYRLVLRALAVTAVAGLLAACSSMPEWTKPSSWYDGVTGSDTPQTEEKAEAKPVAADNQQATQAAAAKSETALPPVEDPLNPEPQGPRIQAADQATEFPNINTQPTPRQALTTESQRRDIRDSLVADRDRAQHTADELRGGTQPAAAPPPPAPAKPAPAVQDKPASTDEEKKDEEKSE